MERTVWVVVWLRSELGGELSNDFASNAIDASIPVVIRRWSR